MQSNLLIARIYDIALVIGSPIIAFITWGSRYILPLGFLILLGLSGIYIGYLGFVTFRTGQSTFFSYLDTILDSNFFRTSSENRHNWQAWINAHLPDPEQQKALKKALDETYPQSKWRTLSGAIIFGAGGWIVLTSLSAVIQWFIEKGLNILLP
jgi:hypothetical protein